jgi:hypothetical protein
MDITAIISTFSAEEQQRFIAFLEKKNKRNDTKNIQLFKLLAKDELSSKEIYQKLYKNKQQNAYHALRKRLYQSLIDFIANTCLDEENSVDMQLIKYILAARTFLIHNKPKVAYHILDKAETLAKEHQLFSILNEIYHTKIQYAHTNTSVEIKTLIETFKANQKNHYLEDELNLVYAKIRNTLNNITYKGEVIDFQTLLTETLKEHNISVTESMSFKSLYQLMTIVSISAFITNDYLNIESFLTQTYNTLKNHKTKEKQLYYHIHVVYMIANTLFRNKKFEASIDYLEMMHQLMQSNQKKYDNTFKLKYHLLLALNFNYSNQQNKAIEVLEKIKIPKHADLESLLDIHLSLVMIYIQKSEFKKAHQLFSKFYHTDRYYTEKAGIEWTIKKNLTEIILHIELGNNDLVESRLLSFKRTYQKYLKQIHQERVTIYLGFVEDYYKNPVIVNSEVFKNKIEQSFEWIGVDREDIFVMSFYAWLKSKLENKNLYTTTLQLLNNS